MLVDGQVGACALDDDTTCETGVGRTCPSGLVCAANRCQGGCASDAECPSDGTCLHLPSGDGFCFDARGGADAALPDGGIDAGFDAYTPAHLGVLDACLGPTGGCAIGHDARVYCWGSAADGRLGSGACDATTLASTPTLVPGITNADALACGNGFQCARVPDPGGSQGFGILCWGRADLGQLGRAVSTRCDPTPALVDTGTTALYGARLFAAGAHACVADDGMRHMDCWGENDGIVADGTDPLSAIWTSATEPAWEGTVGGTSVFERVALSEQGACFRTSEPAIYCMGTDAHHELGVAMTPGGLTDPPRIDMLMRSLSVAAGRSHRCALSADRHVQCWGNAETGQLGVAPDTLMTTCGTDRCDPALHPIGTPALSFDALAANGSGDTTCGIVQGQALPGEVVCWGDNLQAQTGLPVSVMELPTDAANAIRPVSFGAGLPLSRAQRIAVGPHAACAIDDQEAMYCWGDYAYDGTPHEHATYFPIEVQP